MRGVLEAHFRNGFSLSSAPPFRIQVLQFSNLQCNVVLTYDRFLIDSWSIRAMMSSALSFSTALRNRGELSSAGGRSYRELIKWLNGQDCSAAEAFWRQKLRNINPSPLFGDSLPSASESCNAGAAALEFCFSPALTRQLQHFAAQNDMNLSTILLGTWAILLSRYTGQADILFVVVVSCRPVRSSGFEDVIANCAAMVPLQLTVRDHDLLLPWLKEAQSHISSAFQHASIPWSRLSGMYKEPLRFDHVVFLEDFPEFRPEHAFPAELPQPEFLSGRFSAVPLTILVRMKEVISLSCTYSKQDLTGEEVKQILGHLHHLIGEVVNEPDPDIQVSGDRLVNAEMT